MERKKSEAKFILSVLDQAGIIAYTDEFGNYKYVNKKWCEATGIPEDEAVGKNVESLIEGSGAMLAQKITYRDVLFHLYLIILTKHRIFQRRSIRCLKNLII